MGDAASSGFGFCWVWGRKGAEARLFLSCGSVGRDTVMSPQNQREVNDLHVPHTQPEWGHETASRSAGPGKLC